MLLKKYGDNLLQLCKAVPGICNGRKLGDILGNFTCFTSNGQSCVDYCLASPGLYRNVRTLSVGDPVLTLSDHCPLEVTIRVNVDTLIDYTDYDFITKPPKLPWNNDISVKFENILQTQEYSSKLNKFVTQNFCFDQSGIDEATDTLSRILIEGAIQSNISTQNINNLVQPTLSKCSKGRAKKRRAHPKWHDISCADAHRNVV